MTRSRARFHRFPGTERVLKAWWQGRLGRSQFFGAVALMAGLLATPAISAAEATPAEGERFDSLPEAVRAAVASHPVIGEQVARLQQQQEQIHGARAGYRPQLRGGVELGQGWENDRYPRYFSLTLSQMVYDFGRTASEVSLAESGVEREEAYLAHTVEDVVWDTVEAYVELLRSRHLMTLAQEQQIGVARIEALARQRRELGAGSGSDEIQARARLEAAEALSMSFSARQNRWRVVLAFLTNAQPVSDLADDLEGRFGGGCSNVDAWTPTAVLIANAQKMEAQALLARERASLMPRLSIESEARQPVAGADERYAGRDYNVALRVSFDLYRGGGIRSGYRAAEHALRAADYAADLARLESRQQVREAASQVDLLAARLRLLAAQAQSQVETRDLYQQQYLSLGTRSLIDLLNAEQEYHATLMEMEQLRHDLVLLQADCLYRSGGLANMFQLDMGAVVHDDMGP